MALWFGKSPARAFERALTAYGLDRCSVYGGHLNIGLPPQSGVTEALITLPTTPTHVGFFEAPLQLEVIAAFVDAPVAQSVQHLFVGTSSDYAAAKTGGFDFAQALKPLQGARLPAVETLVLGDMEMQFNGQPLYGDLGAIDFVFDSFPGLTQLDLYGAISLAGPVRHDRLRSLSLQVDDMNVTQAVVSQGTLTALLCSAFPQLQDLDIDTDDGWDTLEYALPDALFGGQTLPRLQRVAISNPDAAGATALRLFAERRAQSQSPAGN